MGMIFLFCLLTSLMASSRAFTCNDGEMIDYLFRCDGFFDCIDGSDEDDCVATSRSVMFEHESTTEFDACYQSDVFHCLNSNKSCIRSDQRCDGHTDCDNNRDEENCEFVDFAARYLGMAKVNATRWMRSQHNAEWGWKENTPRAIVALYLTDGANFNGSSYEDELIVKEMELELATLLLRRQKTNVPSYELASYINALLAICHDPRNFYGYDLVSYLKEDLENNSFAPPFLYLTLCNAKERVSEVVADQLLNILMIASPNHGFVMELKALATMTLSCMMSNGYINSSFEQNVTQTLNDFKNQQMVDGSFGNVYITALVLQALIANNQKAVGWSIPAAISYLSEAQKYDGSFGNFLTTYFIMPVLNAKSLLDIGKNNCTSSLKTKRSGKSIKGINSKLGKKMMVKYSLNVGDEKYRIHSLMFRTPKNITVLELMELAAEINPKYEFKIYELNKKKYIYEISSIPNDPEHNKFWFICRGLKNETLTIPEQSPDRIRVSENDDIVMWYKTLESL